MLDWSKECSDKNYCGYCIGGPYGSCDGGCFNPANYSEELVQKNRKDHLKQKLSEIQILHQQLLDRETQLKAELVKIALYETDTIKTIGPLRDAE